MIVSTSCLQLRSKLRASVPPLPNRWLFVHRTEAPQLFKGKAQEVVEPWSMVFKRSEDSGRVARSDGATA